MQQAADFLEECETLGHALTDLDAADWSRPTLFKGWSMDDILVHLLFWNRAADMSLGDPGGFSAMMDRVYPEMQASGMRPVENREIEARGRALFEQWQAQYRDMAARWSGADPKDWVKWAGPDMSVRSSITARQMETWAHGQAVFDLLGAVRPESDRLRNIVVLGVNTFGWSHKVQGLKLPATMPFLRLTAPSGAVWSFGEDSASERIEGQAVEFAQVVTQTRNIADTALTVTGPVAQQWMRTAQCFAGGPEAPPAPGARHVALNPRRGA